MPDQRPNIIFLIVDTLRQDRLGAVGYRPAVTPNLDALYMSGYRATEFFANGCVTQVAFPSIFTSTLPFDYGGYNEGINYRPDSFPESLQAAGFETWGMITGHPCSSHFGYGRGFDQFEDAIDLYQWFRSIFKTTLRELLDRWQAGQLDKIALFKVLQEKYRGCLVDTIGYIDNMERLGLPRNGWDRQVTKSMVARELEILERNPDAICTKLVELDQDYRHALGIEYPTEALCKQIAQRKRRRRLNNRLTLISERRAFPARVVNDYFDKFLGERQTDQPFFAFLHYFDLHEAKLLLSNWSPRSVVDLARAVRPATRKRDFSQGGLLYDLALSIVDREVGKLRRSLERRGLSDNTILVISGDHGATAGFPKRTISTKSSDLSRMFFDEFLKVPFFVTGQNIAPGATNALASQLDIGPTILDLAGLTPPTSFQGRSLLSAAEPGPEIVIAENTGNGRCDLLEKPMYISLRGAKIKTVYQVSDFAPRLREVYDLSTDPNEQNNLAESDCFEKERSRHLELLTERLRTVHEQLSSFTR